MDLTYHRTTEPVQTIGVAADHVNGKTNIVLRDDDANIVAVLGLGHEQAAHLGWLLLSTSERARRRQPHEPTGDARHG